MYNCVISSILCLLVCSPAIKSADSRRRFNYNHPPLSENYAPIPVAIVFDGAQAEETKPLSSTEKTITTFHPRFRSLKLSTKADVADTTTINIEDVSTTAVPTTIYTEATTTTTEATTTTKKATTLKSVTLPPKKHAAQEQLIPVAVVYDDPKDQTRTSYGRVYSSINRRGNQRRRRPRPNQIVQENKIIEVSTQKDVTTSLKTTETPVTTQRVREIETKRNVENVKRKVIKSRISGHTDEAKVSVNAKRVKDPVVPIINSENHVYGDRGDFNYRYESGDGTVAFESGVLKTTNQNLTGEAVSGGFSYTDEGGKSISLSYTADENGYRPVGDHLPTPPPVPAAIARALRYLATKPTPAGDDVTESLW